MLVWEEEKRTPSIQPVIAAQPSTTFESPREINRESKPAAPAAVAVPAPFRADATRRVNAADKRIINGKTDVN